MSLDSIVEEIKDLVKEESEIAHRLKEGSRQAEERKRKIEAKFDEMLDKVKYSLASLNLKLVEADCSLVYKSVLKNRRRYSVSVVFDNPLLDKSSQETLVVEASYRGDGGISLFTLYDGRFVDGLYKSGALVEPWSVSYDVHLDEVDFDLIFERFIEFEMDKVRKESKKYKHEFSTGKS